MRVFFGLAPDAGTALAIADWRDRQLTCAGRPVPPANFHLTLAFAGELPAPAVERLCEQFDDWVSRNAVNADTLVLDRTGYWNRPGIYWLGPSAWPDHLDRLAAKLGSLTVAAGSRRDRNSFLPHITLFRRLTAPPPAPALPPAISMRYDHCTLFESRQGRQGVSYHALEEWPLGMTLPG
jgi:2'-5' RNA ligase